jgi:hypothetical protein
VLCSAKLIFLRFGLIVCIILRQAEYVNTEICYFLYCLVQQGLIVCCRICNVVNDYELLAR